MSGGVEPTDTPRKPRVRRALGPYKFDAKAAREFLKSIQYGCWTEVAAATAGVSRKTIYNWLRRGKKKETDQLAKFLADYKAARHLAAKMHIRLLFAAAAKGNTQVSQWFLERRYPAHFGRRDKHELSGPGGKPLPAPAAVVIELPANGSSPPPKGEGR